MQRVVIRVDASVAMGLGHLTRCITLANALAVDGTEICFLMRDHAKAFTPLIEAGGHQWRLLNSSGRCDHVDDTGPLAHAHWLPVSWQEDAEETAREIEKLGSADWLIVDHYALDARWERAQRARARRIFAVDDLADRSHDCDLLLDQNLSLETETRYRGLLPENCQPLLGPQYALLRPDFAGLRRRLAARSGKVERMLVCLGGSDPSNETAKALTALQSLSTGLPHVDVAIGMSNPNGDTVSALCREMPRTMLYRGAENMAELMMKADLAVGAGGVMCWERCCLGLPTIAVDIAVNQVGALKALSAMGAVDYLGPAASVSKEQITRSLDRFMADALTTRTMGEKALSLVDGEGACRVGAAMQSLSDP